MRRSRRSVLGGVGAAATSGLAGLGGCIDRSGGPTDGRPDGPNATTEPEPPTAGDGTATTPEHTPSERADPVPTPWLVRPDALGVGHYAFTRLRPATILDADPSLAPAVRPLVRTPLDVPAVDTLSTLDRVHRIAGDVHVMEGSFDGESLADQLSDADLRETTSYEGHDLYVEDDARAYAVADGRFVRAVFGDTSISVDAAATVRALLDAHAGTTERYPETDDDCRRLLGVLGDGDVVAGGIADGLRDTAAYSSVAEGTRWDVAADRTDVRLAVLYPDPSSTDASTVESSVDGSHPFADATPTVSTDGRTVTATASVPTDRVTAFDPGWDPRNGPYPTAQFEFSYDPDQGTVTVTFYAGDTMEPSNLFVQGSGFADRTGTDQNATGPWQGTTDGDNVSAGTRVVVGATASYDLLVTYRDGDRTVVLGRDRGPDA